MNWYFAATAVISVWLTWQHGYDAGWKARQKALDKDMGAQR